MTSLELRNIEEGREALTKPRENTRIQGFAQDGRQFQKPRKFANYICII
jgi:hypothetical protein